MEKRLQKIKAFFSFVFLCTIVQSNCIFSACSNDIQRTTPDINSSHNDYETVSILSIINCNKLDDFISNKKSDPEHVSDNETYYTDGSCLFVSITKDFYLWDAAKNRYYRFDSHKNLIE